MPHTRSVDLTYEDYRLFPDDGRRHELIAGEHQVTPAPNTRHQVISMNLCRTLGSHVKAQVAGRLLSAPYDVVLSPADVVQPDLLFVSRERTGFIRAEHLAGPPDLAIEILSAGSRRLDEVVKRKLYERHGVREYWVVDPELEVVRVHRLSGEGFVARELSREAGDHLSTPLLPELRVPLIEVFEA